jgi:cation diffusion facilitator family transporter
MIEGRPALAEEKDLERLYRRGLRLEYFNVGYNVAEAAASIAFGLQAGSVALMAFGLDSVVESLSGLVLIWRLRQHGRISREREERIERRAIKLVSITFFILGAYVLYESISKLVLKEKPESSLAGMIIALLSLIVMPVLTKLKYDVGIQISSKALIADAKETLACAFLSLALLLGLGLNYLFGFWQADPIVGMIIVLFLFREGYEVWEEAGDEGSSED